MEVGNPAFAGPRTRGNKARRWSSPGARAARPHAAPPGAAPRGCGPAGKRSQRLASGIGHSSYVKSRSGTLRFQRFEICSMRAMNPAVAGPRTRRNKARRWSSPGARAARPHSAPPGAAPRGCGPAGKRSRRLASGLDQPSYVKSWSGTPLFSTVWNLSHGRVPLTLPGTCPLGVRHARRSRQPGARGHPSQADCRVVVLANVADIPCEAPGRLWGACIDAHGELKKCQNSRDTVTRH